MNDTRDNEQSDNLPVATGEHGDKRELGDAWREVGEQFQQLGGKLADALRRSWSATEDDPESREKMRRLSDDLRAAADRVDRVIDQVGEETRDERASTLRATRRASEQSLEEARVLTAATLRKLNKQLDHLVKRLEDDQRQG